MIKKLEPVRHSINEYLLFAMGLFMVSSVSYADFNKCAHLFPKSTLPAKITEEKADTRELCFRDYAVLYSVNKKTPVFAVEKLNYLRLNGKTARSNNFHEEPKLKVSERATLLDYIRSGYDRGHMAPAADFSDPLSMEESFSLSNMAPQAPRLNRGIWAKNVEKPTRQYAKRASGDVYVFTGPVYTKKKPTTIGRNSVAVPDYFFKLVYDEAKKRAWVYWVENSDYAKIKKPLTYKEFVSITKLNLLGNLEIKD